MALFEPSCGEAYADVFSDATDTDFCVLGYEGRKLKCDAKGVGGLEALVATFDDAKVQYGLLRQIKMDDGGDSRRVKFVMITWVGESAPAMKKGAVTSHKPAVAELFKGHHVSRNVMERGELAQLAADIAADIVKAGATASIKTQSAAFFRQKDAETEIRGIVFEKRVREGKDVLQVDLGGRPMVASASVAKGYASANGTVPAECVK